MSISERIFEIIAEKGISQKEFSEKTGIAQSTISDWKKKGTNPTSDKIMIICDVLGVTPYYLLTGIDAMGSRVKSDAVFVSKDSDEGLLLEMYTGMDIKNRQRLLGYAEGLCEIRRI